MNNLFFIALPYISILILLFGSAYKYKNHRQRNEALNPWAEAKRSLKSSVIEPVEMEKNPQSPIPNPESPIPNPQSLIPNPQALIPFFLPGLCVLIFFHLIGFLLPSSVIAWNEKPVRLLIIETATFALGLATLFSIIIFIINQTMSRGTKLKIVNLKSIDDLNLKSKIVNLKSIVIYTVLFIVVFSGLFVANFYRWGSSWYATVITPYLRSLLKFSPDISAVGVMQIPIKVHIISAFLFIAFIPFTNFFASLVYYLGYFAGNKQGVFLRAVGLFGASIIAASLALHFGNKYEMKKSTNIVHLLTKDNKPVDFEKLSTKNEQRITNNDTVALPADTSKQHL